MDTTEEDKKKADTKSYNKKYYIKNSEHIKEKTRKYKIENDKSVKDKNRKYNIENSERIKDYHKKYYAENAEALKEKNKKYAINRLKNDPIFKMQRNVRARLYGFFRSLRTKKSNKTFDYVGCTPEFLMDHLSRLFKDGMTRENYGSKGWHIDHIIPLSLAKTEEDIKELCHYTNLQPLWWWENLYKSDKLFFVAEFRNQL